MGQSSVCAVGHSSAVAKTGARVQNRKLGGSMPEVIAGIAIPDTALVREATSLAQERESP